MLHKIAVEIQHNTGKEKKYNFRENRGAAAEEQVHEADDYSEKRRGNAHGEVAVPEV